MSGEALREALARAVGEAGVGPPDAASAEACAALGAAPALALRPESGAALAAGLRTLFEHGAAALVRGGGTRLGLGNPPRRADVLLETGGLAAPPEVDAEEGVARAEAGLPLAALADAALEAGWELPLDPPGAGSTLGGALASAAQGPRFGPPRDVVLGLEVALASGERTRSGGRVVKNVTGYDLAKLHLGALGTLGVIEAAWLRLRPRPEAVSALVAPLPSGEEGLRAALDASRRASARVAALLDPSLAAAVEPQAAAGGRALLVLELAGDAPAVELDAKALREALGAEPAEAPLVERVRAVQGGTFGEEGLRLRVTALPSRLGRAAEILHAEGAALLAYPGRGLLYARFPAGPEPWSAQGASAARAAARAAQAAGGEALLEAAPLEARRGLDAFALSEDALALCRAVKAQYDPQGVLQPGRFAGGL